MSLFIHHKSRQAGHRCLHAGRMGGLRPQRSPQNFQVAGDMKHGSGGGVWGWGAVFRHTWCFTEKANEQIC